MIPVYIYKKLSYFQLKEYSLYLYSLVPKNLYNVCNKINKMLNKMRLLFVFLFLIFSVPGNVMVCPYVIHLPSYAYIIITQFAYLSLSIRVYLYKLSSS